VWLHPITIASPIDAKGLLPNTCMVNEPTRTKSNGLPIDIPFYPYTFYTCRTTYKKQGAPDRCPVLSLYFLHVQHRVQKVRGSQSMSCSILILFTRTVPRTKSNGLLIDVPRAAPRTKSKGLPIDVPFYTKHCKLPIDDHDTYHTQQSSAYKKQWASIYIYPSSRYSIKSFRY
jgi:hypothetical protein